MVACVLLCVVSSFGQWRIGLVAAPALTGALNLDVTEREGLLQYPSLGYGAGLPLSYDGRKGKGFQTGIYYAATNQSFVFKYELFNEDYTHRGKKRFRFIKVPVMYRKSGRVAKFVKTSFALGLQYSYTMSYGGGVTVYEPNVYFDLPIIDRDYFKKHGVDAAFQWGTEIAIKKRLDLFTGIKADIMLNNLAVKGITYNTFPIFGKGLGWHPYSVSFQVGLLYVLNRKDYLNLPGNTYRFRPYKRKPKDMR
jgi:hypothetical protein